MVLVIYQLAGRLAYLLMICKVVFSPLCERARHQPRSLTCLSSFVWLSFTFKFILDVFNFVMLHLISCFRCEHVSVLEQGYVEFMTSRGKNQRQRNDVPFVLLPANLKLSTLLNPFRQVAHDWSSQQIYCLCRGSEWSKPVNCPIFCFLLFGLCYNSIQITNEILFNC